MENLLSVLAETHSQVAAARCNKQAFTDGEYTYATDVHEFQDLPSNYDSGGIPIVHLRRLLSFKT